MKFLKVCDKECNRHYLNRATIEDIFVQDIGSTTFIGIRAAGSVCYQPVESWFQDSSKHLHIRIVAFEVVDDLVELLQNDKVQVIDLDNMIEDTLDKYIENI